MDEDAHPEASQQSELPNVPSIPDAGTPTAVAPASVPTHAQVPSLVESAHPEPLRALHMLMKNMGLEALQFTEKLLDESSGTWSCTVTAGSVSVEGQGRGKKAAKRNASSALLGALQQPK